MPRLLIISHQPSENTVTLTKALERGARRPEFGDIEVVVHTPLEADSADVLAADAIVLGTTENFGYMAGLMKDFLERIYYPCLEKTQAKPWALLVRAGMDGTGTRTSIEKIVSGLKWRQVQEPLLLVGEYRADFVEQCEQLGATMSAGLDAGLF